MLTTVKSIPFRKLHNHTVYPSLFLVPAPYLPIISSSPMFSSPTCPLRSATRTNPLLFRYLSTHPGLANQLLPHHYPYPVSSSISRIICSHPQMFLALLFFNFVFCRHSISTFLRSIKSVNSLFQSIVP